MNTNSLCLIEVIVTAREKIKTLGLLLIDACGALEEQTACACCAYFRRLAGPTFGVAKRANRVCDVLKFAVTAVIDTGSSVEQEAVRASLAFIGCSILACLACGVALLAFTTIPVESCRTLGGASVVVKEETAGTRDTAG